MADLFKFTPALEKPENLQKLLVGRESLLRRLLRAIHEASGRKGLQHFLLIGARGIGKTHLLLLIYHTIKGTIRWDKPSEDLADHWEPILFSEEQYGISSLAELLMEILVRLQDQAPDEKLERLLARLKGVWMPGEAERETILDYLLMRRRETGKRLLLLLDNLQLILENFSDEDQGRLREILMSKDLLMVIGTAPVLFEAVLHYEAPFYNFFEIIWLQDVTPGEVEALLKKRLELDGHRGIIEKFSEYRPRIDAIVHLTGGNPRLILSLYQILSQGEILEVERALMKLLDELTPYYQDRMNQLSDQQRKIIEGMALMEGPSTPTEIAHSVRLATNVVTAQLNRLKELGCVRNRGEKAKREVLYDTSDQLFRLWRQMRVEAGRRRLHFLAKFLKIWFTAQELGEFAVQLIEEMMAGLRDAKYERAQEAIHELYYVQKAAPAGIQTPIQLQRIFGLIITDDLAEAQSEIRERQARAKTKNDKKMVALAWNNLGAVYSKKGEYDRAIEAFHKALEIKPDMHEAWYNLGNAYGEKGEYDRAIEAFYKALEIKPDKHEAWYNLGLAYDKKGEYDQAIEAYHKAVEIKPDDHDAWNNLLVLCLNLSLREIHEGNEKRALKYYEDALGYLPQAPKNRAQDVVSLYFKAIFKAKTTSLIEKALDLIEAKGPDWLELLRPYREALCYLKTKDKAILNRLFPEVRQIVEQMVAQVEEKAPASKQSQRSPKTRKKRR